MTGKDPETPLESKEQKNALRRQRYLQNIEHFRAYNRRRYQKNKQKRNDANKKYYQTHKETQSEKGKEYYKKNREKILSRNKEYYLNNKENCKEQQKKHYLKNKEAVVKRNKKWVLENQDKVKIIKKRYKDNHKEESKKYNQQHHLKNRELYKKYKKAWGVKNPDLLKNGKLKARFGINIENFKALLKKQENKCGICQADFLETTPCVDHDHLKGKNGVRGLLCRNCNTGLGGFKDNPELLHRALQWLTGDISYERTVTTPPPVNILIPEKRKHSLKYNFNLTVEQFYNFLEKQEYSCGICQKRFTNEFPHNPAVDHVHDETRRVRGLLCGKCNRSLGNFKDNPEIISKAISWVSKLKGV
jgi:hypothetical protein